MTNKEIIKHILQLLSGVAVVLAGLFIYLGYTTYTAKEVTAEVTDPNTANTPTEQPTQKEQKKNTSFLQGFTSFKSEPKEDKLNILILGVDSRDDNFVGRTDAILVAQLDKATNQTKLLSIPRDSYVEIAGKSKKDKINHAFAFGGVETTKETVENLLGITFDHYAVINFTSYINIVDTLGGIDIDVPFSFTEQDSKGKKHAIKLDKGYQTLSGEEALAYARMRKQDPTGDIGRGKRQQEVIEATVTELKELQSLSTYTSIFNSVRTSVETDIGITDLPTLIPYLDTFKEIESYSLEGKGMFLGGVYYHQLNEEHLNHVKEQFQTTDSGGK